MAAARLVRGAARLVRVAAPGSPFAIRLSLSGLRRRRGVTRAAHIVRPTRLVPGRSLAAAPSPGEGCRAA
ncbi:hypothetical protein Nm8I071_02170 [Nonomuraea sp. TT08I-71]|nr:hypothetical protein Nm8I071_02170 [Nonomuraea sp. TT08I-71]